ncbi:MAG TPA: hypothetical protein VIL01_11630 [Thermomicrobiales bacterium]
MLRHRRGAPVKAFHWLILASALAIGLSTATVAVAQEASPMASPDASPVAAPCVAPTLPPGTPTPMDEGTPEAPDSMADMGTPMAEASPEPGTPADEAMAAAIEAAVLNYVACFNTGVPANYIALSTERYLFENYGSTNPYDAIAEDEAGPSATARVLTVENEMTYPDGRVSADVEVVFNDVWFQHLRIYFVQEDGYWKLDQEIELRPEPEGDTAVVGIALGSPENEYSITPNTPSVATSPVLIFQAMNNGQEVHELIVLQLPEGADPMGLMDGSVSMDQVRFIGAVWDIAPGESKPLVLLNPPPGVYTLLCFFPAPDGTPHVALGMHAQFEVTASAT